MIWGWGKNTILSPPFPWREEKGRGEILKNIYITRNRGKYLIENKYFEYCIFLGDFFSESMKKGSGGRITSLTLEKKGDGKEGGRGRGWLGDATENAAAPAAAGSGGLTAGARQTGGRRSR